MSRRGGPGYLADHRCRSAEIRRAKIGRRKRGLHGPGYHDRRHPRAGHRPRAMTPMPSMSGSPLTQWKSLTDRTTIFRCWNKAMSGIYPPGSTFKPVVAAAADRGRVGDAGLSGTARSASTPCPPGLDDLSSRPWFARPRGRPQASLRRVLLWKSAPGWGSTRSRQTALEIGPGRPPPGIELPGEKSGFIPSQAWKLKRYKAAWQPGRHAQRCHRAGLCHGDADATGAGSSSHRLGPRRPAPAGASSRRPRDAPVAGAAPGISPGMALARVREGMNKVMNEPGGRGHAFRGRSGAWL